MAATLSLRALHETFEAIRERSLPSLTTDELDAVHGQIKVVTGDLKADGLMPERILIIVRRMANDTGLSHLLLNRVVLWSVDHYYADEDA